MLILCSATAFGQQGAATWKTDHVVVRYSDISDDYAAALARVAEAARAIAIDKYAFDMPQSITIHVVTGESPSLTSSAKGEMTLVVRSEADLRRPTDSGFLAIYNVCREVARTALARSMRRYVWLSPSGYEGWIQYLASRLVDDVAVQEGPDLWPDKYDYIADGTQRVKKRYEGVTDNTIWQGTLMWSALGDIVGDKGFARVFAAWGVLSPNPQKPTAAVRRAFLQAVPGEAAADWWAKAEPLLVQAFPKARLGSDATLVGQPTVLSHDKGEAVQALAIPAEGCAVGFEVDSDDWYRTGIDVYGARSIQGGPAKKILNIWLCDEHLQEIARFSQSASAFPINGQGLMSVKISGIRVPRAFLVCVSSVPPGDGDILISTCGGDASYNFTGMPDGDLTPCPGGNWMIRATVDRSKAPYKGEAEGDNQAGDDEEAQ
jgi:hypothetical protein